MQEPLRLMAILAHPDDESLGFGGALAKYASEGVEVSLVVATRGERGWQGEPDANPGIETMAAVRETELRSAASVLGINRTVFLDEIDGELGQADSGRVIERLVAEIRQVRPQVVVTFGSDGAYGHPDHIAISQLTTAAIVCAADAAFLTPVETQPFRVRKLYHRIWTAAEIAVLRSVLGEISIDVDDSLRSMVEWPEWAVSARVDTADFWWEVQCAVLCHRSQVGGNSTLAELGPRDLRLLWGTQQFSRAMSTVEIDQQIESDLFAGLRPDESSASQYDAAYVPLIGS